MSITNSTHVAIIPDGNRRWAKINSLQEAKGHEAGFEALRKILTECQNIGPTILSFYAFSTENFNRSKIEVNNLFSLLDKVLEKFSYELKEKDIQLRISGSKNNLPPSLLKKLQKATDLCNTGKFILNICFNYGSQEELVQVAKMISMQSIQGIVTPEQITKEYFESLLWNSDLPPVDLLIRTSGEQRISNFMLWQCAYAEFIFVNKLWPDFTPVDFAEALKEYTNRQRRYGK